MRQCSGWWGALLPTKAAPRGSCAASLSRPDDYPPITPLSDPGVRPHLQRGSAQAVATRPPDGARNSPGAAVWPRLAPQGPRPPPLAVS